MNEGELRQIFKNLSDCYADTSEYDKHGKLQEGEVVQAMTEDKFIELVNNIFGFTVNELNRNILKTL